MEAEASVERYLGEDISHEALSTPLPDAVSEEVIRNLRQEFRRYWSIDPGRALELAERIVAIGQARGDIDQVALGRMTRGDILKFLGRTEEAWEDLEQAGKLYLETGNEVGWARTHVGRLHLSTMLNRVEEELANAERAREILIRHGEKDKLLPLLFQIAYVHNHLSQPHEALKEYSRALKIAEELGEAGKNYLVTVNANIGSAYESLGDLHKAQEYYNVAYALAVERGENLHLATIETNIAYLAQAQGNFRRALLWFQRALARASDKFRVEVTNIKQHMVECYLGLSRPYEARQLANQVIAEYRELKDAFELARSLLFLGSAEAELGNFETAQAALEEAEEIYKSLGADTRTAQIWLRRGRIALQLGEVDRALNLAQQAEDQFRSAGQQLREAEANLLKGQALCMLEDLVTAAAAGKKALHVAQRDNIPSLRYSAHLLLGQVNQRQSVVGRARRHYQAATTTVERVQQGLTITLQPGFLEDKWEAWRALIGLHLDQGHVRKAFETLERAKAQVLLGYLANRERLRWNREDAPSQTLIKELNQLRGEHKWFYRLAHETPHHDHQEQASSMAPEQALGEARWRERRMRAITEDLYLYSAEGQAFNPAPTPTIEEIQDSLGEDSLLVEYYHDGEQVWAFALDKDAIEIQRLPLKLAELTQILRQLQVNLGAALKIGPQATTLPNLTRLAHGILRRLHTAIVKPLLLEQRKKARLIIVPYGPLHYLPFHLLCDGASYLIEEYEVVILPAAGLTTRHGPRRQPGAMVLAHSWDGRLPQTRVEAEKVHELFPGKLCSDQAAERSVLQSPPCQILHIAAHGHHRLDHPDLSFIELSDGQLYTDDLLQQDLSYELVTLSACETGRANVSGGDELIGLGRGFLYAGAGALVLSLWKVNDATTTQLMEEMYKALRDGASKAAALREAQKTLLAEGDRLHPAFWGAFQLVGDPSPLSTRAD